MATLNGADIADKIILFVAAVVNHLWDDDKQYRFVRDGFAAFTPLSAHH